MGPEGFSPELRLAIDLARRAGREILLPVLSLGRHGVAAEYKGPRELVTEIDRRVERFLERELRGAFPEISIYAEEEIQEEEAAEGRWIVDPLDGTTNFVHGLPTFGVSIGLQRAGRIDAAVVYAPYVDELFFAERGRGAYFNSDRIRLEVTDTSRLIEALLSTGFAYDRQRHPNLAAWCRLSEQSRGLRRCGSAALDLCYVACGRYDGFWEAGLAAYDVAAGALLVEEAGGRVTDYDGGDDWLFGRAIVATNGTLHETLRREVLAARSEGPDPAFGDQGLSR
jgi:myo-inositol-1(or 4)-monophosphatase